MQWRAFLVRRSKRWRGVRDDKEQLELVEFQPGTIYKYYYNLEDSDPGIMMETNVATKEVSTMVVDKHRNALLSITLTCIYGTTLFKSIKSFNARTIFN